MENRKLLIRIVPYIAIVLAAVVARVIPHAPNFAPIGALAIFTGYHFKNKLAWLFPISAMVISDFIIGLHSTIPYVYVSFIIMSLVGSAIKNNKGRTLFATSLASSLVFFLITNFGVWATGTMYIKTREGLMQSYAMGIPFFRNTVFSDLFYIFSFFYGYEHIKNITRVKLLKYKPPQA